MSWLTKQGTAKKFQEIPLQEGSRDKSGRYQRLTGELVHSKRNTTILDALGMAFGADQIRRYVKGGILNGVESCQKRYHRDI